MQLVRTLQSYCASQSVVATIGNFDGVHLGHQMVLKKIIQKGQELKLPTMVIAFEPSAKEFFLKEQAPARLTNFREKFSLIRELGIDKFVCLNFNNELANTPAQTFIESLLVETLRVHSLTVGDNFRFGKNRAGDINLLQELAKPLGYQVEDTDSFTSNKRRVSSTLIRDLLEKGELQEAERLLGHPYSMQGHVMHGEKKGRTIGFHTANIPINRIKSAVSGVFAVEVMLENGDQYKGVANVGHRPTVGGTRTQLEVHLFEFSQDIYGELVKVTFLHKIRDEKKFASFDELKLQIQKDSKSAKDILNTSAYL